MENPAENEVETGVDVGWIWGLGFGSVGIYWGRVGPQKNQVLMASHGVCRVWW